MTDPALERVWRSYMRFIVEEAHPDRYSIGPLIEAIALPRASGGFLSGQSEKVLGHIQANYPKAWAKYEALVAREEATP